MTKERRLAIEMWKHIAEELENDSCVDIIFLKKEFSIKHNIYWIHDCWLCEYFRDDDDSCSKCPIFIELSERVGKIDISECSGCYSNCSEKSLYEMARNGDAKSAWKIVELLENKKIGE